MIENLSESYFRKHFMPTCYCCGRHYAAYKTVSGHYFSSCKECLSIATEHLRKKDINWPRINGNKDIKWISITPLMRLRYIVSMLFERLHISVNTGNRGKLAITSLLAYKIRGSQWSIG